MSRDPGLFLQDIAEACTKINLLVQDHDVTVLSEDWRIRDAILHNLEVIGEAVKRIPEDLKTPVPEIPWKRIAGFRDVLAHAYFSIDDAIVWDVASNQVSPLLEAATRMLAQLEP